ncbi:GNAT family N-acetyltransferase [Synechococcus elongatus]|uniref:N-acetyltransferase domain-containing protein n=2 Tax=Synechococcus elongatus TaxID=32046 RepID=Q31KZ9_SYNE7|nr:GNAT family N-acetyltransferase [Synechococcus elongatus]ABB58270.1 conserved hypothetical protein YCF52 [Synechococcus elongatus PCC 7942 = FACHB-805]AJD57259.1 hypothetical protein M744_05135 [Synechococcus elongatus UTEX 2973]MBD2586992.1 GNAT family N-acetyltransferase [Synechococcus elongatus FACHB-242]MBD2688063.1 GNAT family N-acetyltransferase [Synechococcus elongatus FACHB-1061]MBD2706226.1 GNAT family N-acetyltransferase [Synechococcus elongatus PCC 7942 = FACHB-805]
MSNSRVVYQIHTPEEFRGGHSAARRLDFEQLRRLFELTAFWGRDRSIEQLQIAVRNSEPVVSAHIGDRLLGFARATSDGIYRATIWDVIVHPDFQGSGIGRKLVETVLSHPHVSHAERVYLMTTHQQRFYEKVGFSVNSTTTMVLFNQELPVSCQTSDRSAEALALAEVVELPQTP